MTVSVETVPLNTFVPGNKTGCGTRPMKEQLNLQIDLLAEKEITNFL
jgi:hypothetical protein